MTSDTNLKKLDQAVHYQKLACTSLQLFLTAVGLYGPLRSTVDRHFRNHFEMLMWRLHDLGGIWGLLPEIDLLMASRSVEKFLFDPEIPTDRKAHELFTFLSRTSSLELEKAFREAGDSITESMFRLIYLQEQEDIQAIHEWLTTK